MICGVDLSSTVLRVALADRHRGALTIRALHSRPLDSGGSLTAQVAAALREWAVAALELHVGVPGEWATYRLLDLPPAPPRDVARMISPALAALLPFPLADGLVAHAPVGAHAGEGRTVCAAFAHRAEIAALVAGLATEGCAVESVQPAPFAVLRAIGGILETAGELVFVDVTPDAPTLAVFRDGRPALVRALRVDAPPGSVDALRDLAQELRWTIAVSARGPAPRTVIGGPDAPAQALAGELRGALPVLTLSELPVPRAAEAQRPVHAEYAVALGLALGVGHRTLPCPGFDLGDVCGDLSETRAVRRQLRRTRSVAAAALALLAAHAGLDYAAARARLASVERAVASHLAGVSTPEAPVRSVAELRERLAVLEASAATVTPRAGPLDLLRHLSRATPGDLDVGIDEIEIDGLGADVRGRAADLATVTRWLVALRAYAGGLDPSAPEVAATAAGVRFRLRVRVVTAAPGSDPGAATEAGT
jgi:hypothetical protein